MYFAYSIILQTGIVQIVQFSSVILDSPSPGNVKKTPKSPTPEKVSAAAIPSSKPSAKKLVVGELLQTEINYCRILSNVLTVCVDHHTVLLCQKLLQTFK